MNGRIIRIEPNHLLPVFRNDEYLVTVEVDRTIRPEGKITFPVQHLPNIAGEERTLLSWIEFVWTWHVWPMLTASKALDDQLSGHQLPMP